MSSAATPSAIPLRDIPPAEDLDLVRVYVWELPVRVTHWLIVLSILVLSATGLYIGRPFLISSGPAWQNHLMATAKVIHFYAAIAFGVSVMARIFWMFTGNNFARWDKFIPIHQRRRRGLLPTLKFYLFALRKPPGFIGHNPIAGITYTLVFGLYFLITLSGLAMYSIDAPVGSVFRKFQWLIPLFGGLPWARWIHHVIMWLLLGFAVHHVYSAILMSKVEATGTIESIFSGYKFVPHEDVIYSGYRFLPRRKTPKGQDDE